MKIEYTIEETTVRVAISGELDTPTTVEIQPKVDALLKFAGRTIYLDCSGLEYIASSGLRQLITIYKRCVAEGGKLILRNVNPDVMEIFTITNFDKVFTFE